MLNNANAQLKINSTGKVGIGTNSPMYQLHTVGNTCLNGTTRFNNWTDVMVDWTGTCGAGTMYGSRDWYFILGKFNRRLGGVHAYQVRYAQLIQDSDDSLKTNVNSISNPLDLIQQLSGKTYFFRSSFTDSIPDSARADYLRKKFGFMAREVKTVIPEIVYYDSSFDRYGVDYVSIVPILTEGIKQQQTYITNLQSSYTNLLNNYNLLSQQVTELQSATEQDINNLWEQLNSCCNLSTGAQSQNNFNTNDATDNKSLNKKLSIGTTLIPNAALYQNTPNPFTTETVIKFQIPTETKNAQIRVYTLIGEEIAAYSLNGISGDKGLKINAGTLKAGQYLYTLVIDNKEIDTKKMIITN